MKLVGRRPETAKHHLNPSPKRPNTLRNRKQKTVETLPTEPKKKKKKEKIADHKPESLEQQNTLQN